MKKTALKITNLTCAHCTITLDGHLEETKGILSAKTNYYRAVSEIEYDESVISEEEICAILEKAGYKVIKNAE